MAASGGRIAADARDQPAHRALAGLLAAAVDGGQRRTGVAAVDDVVEAGDRDIARHRQAQRRRLSEQAQRDQVVVGHHRVGCVRAQQHFGGDALALVGAGLGHIMAVQLGPAALEGLLQPEPALLAPARAGESHIAQAPMAQLAQVAAEHRGGGAVVDADAAAVLLCRRSAVVDHRHVRGAQPGQRLVRQPRADDQAVDPPAQRLPCRQLRRQALGDVGEQQVQPRLGRRARGAADQAGEVRVAHIQHHDADVAGAAGDHAACHRVGAVAQVPHRLRHPLLDLAGEALAAVEELRYRRGRHAGRLGDIADRRGAAATRRCRGGQIRGVGRRFVIHGRRRSLCCVMTWAMFCTHHKRRCLDEVNIYLFVLTLISLVFGGDD